MGNSNAYLWGKAASAVFFPARTCLRCGGTALSGGLCPRCRQELAALHTCAHCATFVPATETADYRCSCCRGEDTGFELARAALPYRGVARERLLAFKYQSRVGLRRPLAALLLEVVAGDLAGVRFDAVIPLPLSPGRLRQRGYNQSQLLTAILSAELGLDHRPELLTRRRETRPLFELNRKQREAELKGAFQASPEAKGLRLLLVDDIYTTGATAASASRALRRAQASQVWFLTVAAGTEGE